MADPPARILWTRAGDRLVAETGIAHVEIRKPDERYLVEFFDTRKPWRGFVMAWSYHTSERAAKRGARDAALRIGVWSVSGG